MVIIKTIVTIWQPYFYRHSIEKHERWVSKHLSKGFFKKWSLLIFHLDDLNMVHF